MCIPKTIPTISPIAITTFKQNESVVVTDPKGEMYADTAELYRKNGYEVKVFNLVEPEHSDSWNCMSDLNGNGHLAQVLTSVIIGNTSEGKGDHFWDNAENNFLKALILYVDTMYREDTNKCNLAFVYDLLGESNDELNARFMALPPNSKALKAYNIYKKSGETVKTGMGDLESASTKYTAAAEIKNMAMLSQSGEVPTAPL